MTTVQSCDDARRHLGAMRDREALPDPGVEEHLEACPGCQVWLDDVDRMTRAFRLAPASEPRFVDDALAMWDVRSDATSGRQLLGRMMIAVAALGCLVVGVLIAFGSAGHTHTGVTAQREVIILEIALAFGLACAAARPDPFLAGVTPIIAVVGVVNIGVSVINLGSGHSTLVDEIAHVPFIIGLVGAVILRRTLPEPTLVARSAERLRA